MPLSHHCRTADERQLQTNSWVRGLFWIGLISLHTFNLTYYAGVAWLYRQFDFSFLQHQLDLGSIGIKSFEYPKVSQIHACVAAIHAFFMILMVVTSIHARKLVFQPDLRVVTTTLTRKAFASSVLRRLHRKYRQLRESASVSSATSLRRTSRLVVSLNELSEAAGRTGSLIFARDGVLGVDSVYFDHVLLLRELIETSLQTYQLYRMTLVLPRLWLVRLYLTLLVANCWIVPFLHRYYRDRESLRRILCLLCDAVLDVVSSIGVSIAIFVTYAPQYTDPTGFGFPRNIWFDDEWFSRMQQEFQIMVIASWADMALRLVFAVGLIQCMEAIKEMMSPVTATQEMPTNFKASIVPVVGAPPGPAELLVPQAIMPSTSVPDEPKTKIPRSAAAITKAETDRVERGPSKRSISTCIHGLISYVVHTVGPGLFVVWGCALVVIHLSAEFVHNDAKCSLPLKPWFSFKPGCSLIDIDCSTLHSSGHDEAIALAWDTFEPDRAAGLVVRHCPELLIPTRISRYHHITTIKLYNSTITDWTDSAALTMEHHENLRAIYMIRTFTATGELPRGLQSSNFPKGVVTFIMCITNLHTLPSDLDTKWPKGILLTLDFSPLRNVPDVLSRLQPTMVSFAGAPVTVVSTEMLEIPQLLFFQASMSRLQELPRYVNHLNPVFRAMMLQNTNVSTFWSWIDSYAHYVHNFPVKLFNAFGTPYCRELLQIAANSRTSFSVPPEPDHSILMNVSTPEKIEFAMQSVDCTTPGLPTYFPLPLDDAKYGWRPDDGEA